MVNNYLNDFGVSNPSETIKPIVPFDTTGITSNVPSVTLDGQSGSTAVDTSSDTRVRLRAMRNQETQIYGDPGDSTNILSILHPSSDGTDGLLFPYTPTISVSQNVDYKPIEMVHTNGDIAAYGHTPSVTLSVTGDFTVQNQREGRYALAVIHFLRTVSKMYFGEADAKTNLAGLPPPVLIFSGYGTYIFNNLPVILKSHSYSFDKAMNMSSFVTDQGVTKLPTMFSIAMELQVQQTPQAMRKTFSLDAFRTGKLMRDSTSGSGWI
jgi:hypothetical protein